METKEPLEPEQRETKEPSEPEQRETAQPEKWKLAKKLVLAVFVISVFAIRVEWDQVAVRLSFIHAVNPTLAVPWSYAHATDPSWMNCSLNNNTHLRWCTNLSTWWQLPPFTQFAALNWHSSPTDGFWSELTPTERAEVGPLMGAKDKRSCQESGNWPCCIGVTHNGGGHQWSNTCLKKPERFYLRFRKDGARIKFLNGIDLYNAVAGRTVLIQGDSVAHQYEAALLCSMRRANCTLEYKSYSKNLDKFKKAVDWCPGWREGTRAITETIVRCKENAAVESAQSFARFVFLRSYTPCIQCHNGSWHWRSQALIRRFDPDVIMLPISGAHYNKGARYDRCHDKKPLLTALRSVYSSDLMRDYMEAPDKLVVVMEANHQHYFFKSDGGYGHSAVKTNISLLADKEKCGPTVHWDNDPFWRERYATQVLTQELARKIYFPKGSQPHLSLNCSELGNANASSPNCEKGSTPIPIESAHVAWLPFNKLSDSRPDIHSGGGDCTHVCYGPLFWEPFVDAFASIVRSKYKYASTKHDHLNESNSSFIVDSVADFVTEPNTTTTTTTTTTVRV